MCIDKGLNRLYSDYFGAAPKSVVMAMPGEIGKGQIAQVITKQGVVLSEWEMKYNTDVSVEGMSSEEYIQFLFCLNDSVSWTVEGVKDELNLKAGEACAYRGRGEKEHLCYYGDKDYSFKCLRFPAAYLKGLLDDYFGLDMRTSYEEKLWNDISKIRISPHMQHIFSELKEFSRYTGGLGNLFLDSKIHELLAAYLSEALEIGIVDHKISKLARSDQEAIRDAQRIIDSQLAYAPSIEQLSRLVGISLSKLSKGFSALYGMPVHAYIIDKRMEKAASLLMNGEYTITQIASMVGYSKPSNFAAAFKRKYGVVALNAIKCLMRQSHFFRRKGYVEDTQKEWICHYYSYSIFGSIDEHVSDGLCRVE